MESADDDDCHSNKSLDLNFGKKLIDFKLSPSSCSGQEEQPSPQTSSTSAPQAATEVQDERSASSPAAKQDYKHVCRVCRKNFRFATTLARHERAHLSEETPAPAPTEDVLKEEAAESNDAKPAEDEKEEEQKEAELDEGGKGGESEVGESGESEEEKEKEERSDEETSEPKSLEGGRVDKRKKICNVCSKRFWSLQDLTRHMRSHTGTLVWFLSFTLFICVLFHLNS